jgi:hypothetical protein
MPILLLACLLNLFEGLLDKNYFVLAGGEINRTLPRPQSVEPFFQTHQISIPEVCDYFCT